MSHYDDKVYPAKFRYQGDVAKNYLAEREGATKWKKEQEIISHLLGSLPRESSILDVPLGTGRFLPLYFEKHRIYGVDISWDMLQVSAQLEKPDDYLVNLVRADAESLPFGNGTIDYIICTRLMNWLPPRVLKTVLLELKRVARKGLFIEIRVFKRLSLKELCRELCAETFSNEAPQIRKFFYLLRRGILMFVKVIRRAIITRGSTTRKYRGGERTGGYFFHDFDEVINLFAEQQLTIDDLFLVEKRIDFDSLASQPYFLYSLRPK